MRARYLALFCLVMSALQAQNEHQMPMPDMHHGMQMNAAGMYLMNMASGTSLNPSSWPMPMLMPRVGSWNLMFMGRRFSSTFSNQVGVGATNCIPRTR